MEKILERFLFSSRWLPAPFYVGLVVTLVMLLLKAARELVHFVVSGLRSTEADIIVGALSLVDLTLTASLIVIVIFSGYENFVSRIDAAEHQDWPEWMGKIDFTGLKLKLLSSIVAISAIQVLKAFMNVKNLSDRELMCMWSCTWSSWARASCLRLPTGSARAATGLSTSCRPRTRCNGSKPRPRR